MVDLVPAIVERMYRDLASHKSPQPQPVSVETTAKQITLTKADVDAILQRTRSGSIEELEFVIAHAKEFILTDGQRDQLCCDLTIAAAQRSRQGNGRRSDGNAEFISKVLGLIDKSIRRLGFWPDRSWTTYCVTARGIYLAVVCIALRIAPVGAPSARSSIRLELMGRRVRRDGRR
jgi:hypothetical protein